MADITALGLTFEPLFEFKAKKSWIILQIVPKMICEAVSTN